MGYQFVDLVGRIIPSVMVFNADQANVPDRFGAISPPSLADVRLTEKG